MTPRACLVAVTALPNGALIASAGNANRQRQPATPTGNANRQRQPATKASARRMSNDSPTRAPAQGKVPRLRSAAFQIDVLFVGSLMIAATLSRLYALASAIGSSDAQPRA